MCLKKYFRRMQKRNYKVKKEQRTGKPYDFLKSICLSICLLSWNKGQKRADPEVEARSLLPLIIGVERITRFTVATISVLTKALLHRMSELSLMIYRVLSTSSHFGCRPQCNNVSKFWSSFSLHRLSHWLVRCDLCQALTLEAFRTN